MDFTVQEEDKLIKMVQTNTELFDFLHEKYKDPVHRDNVWADIAKTIGKSVKECKTKWKYIRDTHNRCKRKLNARSADKYLPAANRLSFLNTVECPRSSTGEGGTAQSGDEKKEKRLHAKGQVDKLAMFLSKRTEEKTRARKKVEDKSQMISNTKNYEDDDVDLFFKSLALTVKKLPTIAIVEAKINTLNIVTKLEKKYCFSQQSMPLIEVPTYCNQIQNDDDSTSSTSPTDLSQSSKKFISTVNDSKEVQSFYNQ